MLSQQLLAANGQLQMLKLTMEVAENVDGICTIFRIRSVHMALCFKLNAALAFLSL
jgi:hypothetical protein